MNRKHAAGGIFVAGMLAMLSGFFVFSVAPAYGITIVPTCARQVSCTGGDCPPPSLNCAITAFRNVASLIVGVTGSFALLMFVYGGFMLLTSGGVEAKVTTGKTILKNALIGIVLVFTAGYIIDYGIKALQGRREFAEGTACDNGEGKYRIEGNHAICRPLCASPGRRSLGYECTPNPDWVSCIADTYDCGRASTATSGRSCCLPPPPPPVNAPPEESIDPETPFGTP